MINKKVWNKAFTKEMDTRREELESGKVRGYTLEEAIRDARKKFKNNQPWLGVSRAKALAESM